MKKNGLVAGLIGFMKLEKDQDRATFQAEVLSQITDYKNLDMDKKDLLAQALLVGLDLNAEEDQKFRELIEKSPKFQRTKTVIKTWYRQGIEEGEEK